jgi:hypothetical protein
MHVITVLGQTVAATCSDFYYYSPA